VLWFESFYNFWQVQAKEDKLLGNATTLIGPCIVNKHVCTDNARFHLQLANGLRRTPMTSARELELLGEPTVDPSIETPNPVFFFEISQLSDSNETRNAQFREDFRQFLGVTEGFPAAPKFPPQNVLFGAEKLLEGRKYRIDICDDAYASVRAVLMEHARNTAAWIREFFLYREDVSISSREYVYELMEAYLHDPCDEKQ
jgi:hypothetical protein